MSYFELLLTPLTCIPLNVYIYIMYRTFNTFDMRKKGVISNLLCVLLFLLTWVPLNVCMFIVYRVPLTPLKCFNIYMIWWYGWKALSLSFSKLQSDWKSVKYSESYEQKCVYACILSFFQHLRYTKHLMHWNLYHLLRHLQHIFDLLFIVHYSISHL